MKIKLNPSYFSRNRHREKEYEDMFSMAYKSLSGLSHIIFLILFPPVIAISNLFSHGVFLSLMNICLSIGYCAKFFQRIKNSEVNITEFTVSFVFLCIAQAITFYLAPAISLMNLIDVIGLFNLIATGVNSFFLVRNLILPPFQSFIHYVFMLFGYQITTSSFNKAPLSLEHDRPVIDKLLRKFYKHDSFSDVFNEDEIRPFNHILSTLSDYINKYNEPFLGNLMNHDRIQALENGVSQLILSGSTENSLVFINRKIDYKSTKINLLKQARACLIDENKEKKQFNWRFFESVSNVSEEEQEETYEVCLSLLNNEIDRQNKKRDLLKICLPG